MGPDDAPLPRLGAWHQEPLLPALQVGAARRFRRRGRGRQHARIEGNPARLDHRLRRVPGMSVRGVTLRRIATGAGAVVLGIIALDLIATAATIAIGASWLRR